MTLAATHHRLFIALWPDAACRDVLLAWLQGRRWPPGAAPVPPARWHLTLHFIGPVPAARVPTLAPALRLPVPPCEITFGRVVQWPRGLLVIEPVDVPQALLDLHAALGERLRACALPVEARAWRPHLTLARRAAGAVLPAAALPPLRWRVDEAALVESAHGYRTLARWS